VALPLVPDFILVLGAVAALIWVLVPRLMFGMGQLRLRNLINERPEDAAPPPDDADGTRRYRQFLELGFRPLGTVEESCWFINPIKWHWRAAGVIRFLATPDGRKLASLHRMIPEEPICFSVVTILSGGGMVSTTCPGAGPIPGELRALRLQLHGVEPEALVRHHDEQVATFCAKAGLTVTPASLAEAVAIDAAHTREFLLRAGEKLRGMTWLFITPALFATLSVHGGFVPTDWRALAFGLCVGGVVFTLFKLWNEWTIRRAVLRRHTVPPQ
jgi:hypothetical protein